MTRTMNARIAGFAFLLYIAIGIAGMVLSRRWSGGEGIAAKLASMAAHASDVRIALVLVLFTGLAALVLGVSLYALTRDEDRDLAMLGLSCRVAEGVIGGLSIQRSLGLLWLATVAGANAPDSQAAQNIGGSFLCKAQAPSLALSSSLSAARPSPGFSSAAA